MIFGAGAAFHGSLRGRGRHRGCLFLTSWRTTSRSGSVIREPVTASRRSPTWPSSASPSAPSAASPYAFSVLAAIAVAAFGWGYVWGLVGSAWRPPLLLGGTLSARPGGPTAGRHRWPPSSRWPRRRRRPRSSATACSTPSDRALGLAGQVDTLAETNDLLTMLNAVARTLPTSLNQREAIDAARGQLVDTFAPDVICLLSSTRPTTSGSRSWPRAAR